jgi:uncharacterized Zn-binding protein involved in type VI secretion
MPKIIRHTDLTQGHCWPPCPGVPDPQAAKFLAGQAQVTVDGLYPVLVGDVYNVHAGPCGLIPPHDPGSTVCTIGSTTVFIYDIPIVRDSDPLTCGDVADAGSTNVYVEGGGFGGPEATPEDPGESTGFSVWPPYINYPSMSFPYRSNRRVLQQGYQGSNGVVPTTYIYTFMGSTPAAYQPEAYSPLEEGGSHSMYRNYPGPPLSEQAGARLPSYAPTYYTSPIPITNFSAIVEYIISEIPKTNVITGGSIVPGINFNGDTGEISGQLTGLPPADSINVYVSAKNQVASEPKKFTIYFPATVYGTGF